MRLRLVLSCWVCVYQPQQEACSFQEQGDQKVACCCNKKLAAEHGYGNTVKEALNANKRNAI
jgi:hypothetical protein